MAVQEERFAVLDDGLPATKDRAAAFLEEPFGDELLDRAARLERGVQLNDRVRPKKPLPELTIDVRGNPLVTNDDKAASVVGVVVDETLA